MFKYLWVFEVVVVANLVVEIIVIGRCLLDVVVACNLPGPRWFENFVVEGGWFDARVVVGCSIVHCGILRDDSTYREIVVDSIGKELNPRVTDLQE